MGKINVEELDAAVLFTALVENACEVLKRRGDKNVPSFDQQILLNHAQECLRQNGGKFFLAEYQGIQLGTTFGEKEIDLEKYNKAYGTDAAQRAIYRTYTDAPFKSPKILKKLLASDDTNAFGRGFFQAYEVTRSRLILPELLPALGLPASRPDHSYHR